MELQEVNKIMFALTITPMVLKQAVDRNCDMIISHHPLFFVPLEYRKINMYCAHTNLDKAQGGTTDILMKKFGFKGKCHNVISLELLNWKSLYPLKN